MLIIKNANVIFPDKIRKKTERSNSSCSLRKITHRCKTASPGTQQDTGQSAEDIAQMEGRITANADGNDHTDGRSNAGQCCHHSHKDNLLGRNFLHFLFFSFLFRQSAD